METNIRELPLQERSRQRVEMVVEATKIVLVEKGYSDLTLAAVCDQADIKQTSIYRYWPIMTGRKPTACWRRNACMTRAALLARKAQRLIRTAQAMR